MAATFPASTKGGGNSASFPDVCHMPAPPPPAGPGGIPTPYPNKGDLTTTDKMTQKVLIKAKGTVVETSKTAGSSGMEPGTTKGLVSNAPNHMDNLQAANMVDACAANGSMGAKVLQSKAIKNVMTQMGTTPSGATQAVQMGKSSIPKVAGNEAGSMKSVHSNAVISKFKAHVAHKGEGTFVTNIRSMMQEAEAEPEPSTDSKSQKT